MLETGLIVMTVGLGTVFIFLIIMVLTMHVTYFLMKNVVNKLFPEQVVSVVNTSVNDDTEKAIAIAVAKILG